MRLKENVDIVCFLQVVKECEADVYLETDENDRLNLKSVLSQYVAVVMTSDKELMKRCHITCNDKDCEKLMEFMEA